MMFQYCRYVDTAPENMFPIIMISSSPTALITMYNVRRFLQESVYVTLAFLHTLCGHRYFFLPSFRTSFEPSAEARARAAAKATRRQRI